MGKKEKTLPPGPNPRPDQMTEKDQRQLRDYQKTPKGPIEGGKEPEEKPGGPKKKQEKK